MTGRLGRGLVLAATALVAIAGCGGSKAASKGKPSAVSIPGVRSLDFTERQYHLHFFGPLHYVQNPPMGGAHSPVPLNCGVYSTVVPNENAVHSLEHGAVWLTYKPGVDPAPLAQLTDIDPSYTLVSADPSQPAKVTATAWGLQLGVDTPTDPRLRSFVQAYAGNGFGGEQGSRCAGASPEQAVQFLQDPPRKNASPPPDPADRPG